MNQITIIGHLGNDAKLHTLGNQQVINFSVAVADDYKDASGTWVQRTVWYPVSFWRERKTDDLVKGTLVMVQGTPRLNSYKNQQGQDVYQISVTATLLKRLSKKENAESNMPMGGVSTPSATPSTYAQNEANAFSAAEVADDLPF